MFFVRFHQRFFAPAWKSSRSEFDFQNRYQRPPVGTGPQCLRLTQNGRYNHRLEPFAARTRERRESISPVLLAKRQKTARMALVVNLTVNRFVIGPASADRQ